MILKYSLIAYTVNGVSKELALNRIFPEEKYSTSSMSKTLCSMTLERDLLNVTVNSKAIPVTGCGGLWGFEMLRIPHCLDSRLTVNCEILATCSSTYSTLCTSQEAHSVSIR
jgi:hypothetical protein